MQYRINALHSALKADDTAPTCLDVSPVNGREDLRMSLEARANSLSQRHASIDRELEAETHRPMPDPAVITKLKREKLRIKDELTRLPSH